ncbi:MAG: hypothetical protein CL532_09525 [Aestuariivita sp.]|nr:hypothetical protein [Aestuariivita sp.]
MEPIFILLVTFLASHDVSSLVLRDENLVEHVTFFNLESCERALINYASQTDPRLELRKNQLGQLEAHTSLKKASKAKVSCLRILLPTMKKLPVS